MASTRYEATWESLNEHRIPPWFMGAKLGIFIHWGIFSVPAWAPPYRAGGEYYNEDIGDHPYAELYGYGLMYKDSKYWKYHCEKYGAAFQYEDFFPMFKAERWDPASWARLFRDIGARYVVLVTKHSDGYCMWPSSFSKRNCYETGPGRDITGELTREVKSHGLKMGLYYSTTFNWYYDRTGHITYRDLVHNQVKELIDAYDPSLFWSDDYWKPIEKSYAATWQSKKLISYFYNHADDPSQVVTNDRWGVEEDGRQLGDYSTPEYSPLPDTPDFYWELCRGIGQSFGYDQNETEADYLSVDGLVMLLSDLVSKNGNLLLNIGPRADGTLDPIQEARLRGLGDWLRVNGEAIFDTMPWVSAEGESPDGVDIRYTCKDGTVYAILHGKLGPEVRIDYIYVKDGTKIGLLGHGATLDWRRTDNGICVRLPEKLSSAHASCLKFGTEPLKIMNRKPKILESKYGEIWRRTGYLKVDI